MKDEAVYKQFWQYSDKHNNCIDMSEYDINNKDEKPDHSSKLIFSLRYEFCCQNGQNQLKV
jgi:hypothetical protein